MYYSLVKCMFYNNLDNLYGSSKLQTCIMQQGNVYYTITCVLLWNSQVSILWDYDKEFKKSI